MAGSIWQRRVAVGADGAATITATSTQLTLDYDSDSNATITVADASHTTIATGETGDLILDAGDDIILDSHVGKWRFKRNGTLTNMLSTTSADGSKMVFDNQIADAGYDFKCSDGGVGITALAIDAANAGAATFNSKVTIGTGAAADTYLNFDGNAVDFRIGLDDGSDTLEIGAGTAHGTTTALTISTLGFVKDASLDSAPADTTYSGITANFVAGEDLEDGEVVYLKTSDGKLWKAVATAAATSRAIAMCTADVSADAEGTFLLQGFAHFATNFPTYTVGAVVYTPEAEAGGKNVPEEAAPDSDGDFVQILGHAATANILYFNPDSTVIEVA